MYKASLRASFEPMVSRIDGLKDMVLTKVNSVAAFHRLFDKLAGHGTCKNISVLCRNSSCMVVDDSMKMESDVASPVDGIVTAVHVVSGQSVEVDQI